MAHRDAARRSFRNLRTLLAIAAFASVAVASTGCASTGDEWRERFLEKERDADSLAGELSQERARRAEAIAELESARAESAALLAENENLKSRPPEVIEVPVADNRLSDTVTDLQSRGIDAVETPEGNIAIVLASDITFGSGSKDLTKQGKKSLTGIARELNGQFAGYSARIEGHTDSDPIRKSKFADNWELGAERSLAVLRYLSTTHGIAPERLSAATRGQTMPLADNKSKAGKSRNRRVEIVVIVPKGTAAAK